MLQDTSAGCSWQQVPYYKRRVTCFCTLVLQAGPSNLHDEHVGCDRVGNIHYLSSQTCRHTQLAGDASSPSFSIIVCAC